MYCEQQGVTINYALILPRVDFIKTIKVESRGNKSCLVKKFNLVAYKKATHAGKTDN